MSKKSPKFKIKYEENDPDYKSDSSSSKSEPQSTRKTRQTSTSSNLEVAKTQKSFSPHMAETISKDELVLPEKDETSLSNQTKNSQSHIQ